MVYSEDDVLAFIERTGETKFSEIQRALRAQEEDRLLSSEERNAITMAILRYEKQLAESAHRERSIDRDARIMMFTSYSLDYTLGAICEFVNRQYAERHGYYFESFVAPFKDILDEIAPKSHCTWYKVKVLRELLSNTALIEEKKIQYFMWIDADAVVIDHSQQLETFIALANHKDLIIGEDMNPCCLVNAGVMLIRVSEWSRQLWEMVWNCTNYDSVYFYEQSALIKTLKSLREGLTQITPFHSFLPGSYQGVKYFPHVAVFPSVDFNSNKGWLKQSRRSRPKTKRKVPLKELIQSVVQAPADSKVSTFDITSAMIHRMEALAVEKLAKCQESNPGAEALTSPGDSACSLPDPPEEAESAQGSESSLDPSLEAKLTEECAKFIFHPAGLPDKLDAVKCILHKFNHQLPPHLSNNITEFVLYRGKSGGLASAENIIT